MRARVRVGRGSEDVIEGVGERVMVLGEGKGLNRVAESLG